MIPENGIGLYEAGFTGLQYWSELVDMLTDALVCEVTEERNGIYELYMEYPAEGRSAGRIAPDMVISAPTSEANTQPFRVYKLERGTDGRLIVYAEHISYELLSVPVMPFTTSGLPSADVVDALVGLAMYSAQNYRFDISTDKTTPGTFTVSTPTAVRSLLMGQQGSILDVFGGGEYLFNEFSVALKASRGADRGVVIEYGKSIEELTNELDISGIYTGVCPYWKGGENGETVVTIPEGAVWNSYADSLSYKRTTVVDFSGDFETQPTEAQLRAKAQSYLAANGATGIPNTITVQVVPYLDSADFEVRSGYPPTITMTEGEVTNVQPAYSSRARVIRLCDTVTIECPPLGISKKAKVVKTVWDAIALRYKELTIGQVAQSLAGTIVGIGNTADGAAAASAQTFLPVSGGTVYGNLNVSGTIMGHGSNYSFLKLVDLGTFSTGAAFQSFYAASGGLKADISSGTFKQAIVGGYVTINGYKFILAHPNYWLNTGDSACTTNHMLVVPAAKIADGKMNTSNTTSGAYAGSYMRTNAIAAAKAIIENCFGAANILTHREYFQNAMSNGYESGGGWYDSTVDLMNERMVYGADVFHNVVHGANFPNTYTIDKTQIALFRERPDLITIRQYCWLRDVASSVAFCYVAGNGQAGQAVASDSVGIRPVFAIC